jgi:ferredoxin
LRRIFLEFKIEFTRTGKTIEWNENYVSILHLAEENGVPIPTDCRMGVCGTCKVKLLSGEVDMESEDGLDKDDKAQNMILPCVSIPKTDLKIEV